MVNKVEVYSSLQSAPIIDFDDSDPIESDYIYLINPEGLGPVKASITVMDSGARDGVLPVGSFVPARNIVLTLRPNPDWDYWSPEALAQAIYAYFTPKNSVKLVFDSDEIGSASIEGIIESCEPNRFSKDPEYQISITCPDPYFTVGDPIVITDSITGPNTWVTDKKPIICAGNIPAGFNLKIPSGFNADIIIQMGNSFVAANPPISSFRLSLDSTGRMVEINTIPGKRYARSINPFTGIYFSIMDAITENSEWPTLRPGDNTIAVMAGSSISLTGKTWELTYNERYGAI